VFGFDDERDVTWFGNIDILPLKDVAVGVEYKQGADFGAFRNADYYEAHVAWLANKNLTLVAAYTNTGSTKSTRTGLGDGFVLSAHYAF
jgi:hypothetical protein